MRTSLFLLASLLQYSSAMPHLAGIKERNLNIANISALDVEHLLNLQSRSLFDLESLLNVIPTTLDLPPVASVGRKRIPDADHPFRPPGPTDQRGGCPGMNIMANYGYIPRNGIATVTEMISGMEEMLGFGPDIAAVIVALGFIASFDITTLKTSIGQTDSRTNGPLSSLFGTAPGFLFKRSLIINSKWMDRCLVWMVILPNGDTNHFDSDHWKKHKQLAMDRYDGLMTAKFWGEARFMQYTDCRNNNPQCQWAIGQQAHAYIAGAFITNTMASADIHGNAGSPDVESIQTFFGIIEHPNGTYSQGYGKLPASSDGYWYRREPLTFDWVLKLGGSNNCLRSLILYSHIQLNLEEIMGNLVNGIQDLTDLRNVVESGVTCWILEQARDTKDNRYDGFPLIKGAIGKLVQNLLAPVFEQLACTKHTT
ncbi:hypothetical protein DFH28DRAFT_1167055 [Melampsora americana]|nr:hypothetical protein DFH28DRAFT_1167055 [Melampsora americana]